MTETDLVTAGDSAEQAELPNTVKSEFSSPATPDTPIGAPAAEPTPTAEVPKDSPSGSLSTMVLPELRALANEVGVKGASGMRKSELIAAIRERREGPKNGASDAPDAQARTSDDDHRQQQRLRARRERGRDHH